jgi:hypothetical protein
LTLYSRLSRVREKGRVDFALVDPGIGESRIDGLADKLLHSGLKVFAKRSHSDADDVDFAHILPSARTICAGGPKTWER